MSLSPAELLLIHFNGTIPRGVYPNCTLKVDCDLTGYVTAQISYYPSLIGNILYLGIFAVLLLVHTTQGILWKTWTYSIAIVLGIVLECVGYYGRIMLSGNPYEFNFFVIYLVTLTIAPVFFTASIYLCLSRLILIHDPSLTLSRFAPKTYTYLFMGADFFSLVLQAVGGALSATANTLDKSWTGVHVMIVGLAFQVFSLVVFSGLCAELTFRVYRSPNHQGREEKQSKLHIFELCLVAATLLILVRSIYRCAELAEGFKGKLANEEVPFMVFEGVMMILACLCLTILHPGWVLRGEWERKMERPRGGEGSELTGMAGKIDGVTEGRDGYINMDR